MLKCFDIPISLQEESTHFGLEVLTNFGLEVSKHFGSKKLYKKN